MIRAVPAFEDNYIWIIGCDTEAADEVVVVLFVVTLFDAKKLVDEALVVLLLVKNVLTWLVLLLPLEARTS